MREIIERSSHDVRNTSLLLKWQSMQAQKLLGRLDMVLCDLDRAYSEWTRMLLRKEECVMKVSFFKVLGLIGVLAEELTAAAMDGKITVKEALRIVEVLCNQLGIEMDKEGFSFGDN